MTKDKKIALLRRTLELADDVIKGYIVDLEARGGVMNYGRKIRRDIIHVLQQTDPGTK